MERPIGETFEYEGVTLQVIEHSSCKKCFFLEKILFKRRYIRKMQQKKGWKVRCVQESKIIKSKTIMKKFDLEEYLKNPSRKVVTRYGKNVRILCTDANMKYPIVALIKEYGTDYVKTYDTNGNVSSVPIDIPYSAYDLFFDEE